MKKNKLCSLMTMDFRRSIGSWKFVMVVLGVCLICLVSMADQIQVIGTWGKGQREQFSSAQQLMTLLNFDRFKTLLIVILAGLYSSSFCEDWNHRYFRFLLSRSNLKAYAYSKILITVAGVVLATILGFLLLVIVLFPFMSVGMGAQEASWYGAYQGLATGSMPVLFVIILGWNFGLSAAFLAVVGLWLSVKQPNGFVAIGGPFLMFYFLYSLSLILPYFISFNDISSNPSILFPNNAVLSFAYNTIFLGVLILVAARGFYRSLRKRWENGML